MRHSTILVCPWCHEATSWSRFLDTFYCSSCRLSETAWIEVTPELMDLIDEARSIKEKAQVLELNADKIV